MAEIQQVETCGAIDATSSEYILFDGGGVGILPVGKHVHRGSFTLDGTTGTDTASLRLALPLASNVCWQMRTWQLSVETTADWVRGMFEYFYAPSTTAFGQSTQLNYPIINAAANDLGTPVQNWLLGYCEHANGEAASWVDTDDHQLPFNLITYKDEAAAANPQIALSTGASAPVAAGTVRFGITWLAYTFEQMSNAVLHAGLNNRN